jgi:hypothetical protein
MAMELLDIETGVPSVFQGEQMKQPETLGQTNIMVDSANITFRSRVKLFADKVLDHHLTRYYDYNMQYHPDEEIKGDYKVDVTGVTALLERDIQTQSMFNLLKFKQDEDVYVNTNWDKLIRNLYQNQRLDVLNSEEERDKKRKAIQQSKSQGNPALEIAKLRANADLEKEKMRIAAQQQEDERRVLLTDKEWTYKLRIEEMKREVAIMELAQVKDLTIGEIKAKLATDAGKMNLQRELSTRGNGKAEQIIEPPSEPPQRAPVGEAFQQ